jgi:putative Mg2+ transporter-C (MgtC) family protein
VSKLLNFLDVTPLSWEGIAVCVFCGFVVGFERQVFGKPAGIRTSILICLGTYIFVTLSVVVANAVADPARVIGQVVTGVGFLGAGVMFFSKRGSIVGLTSAAIIWLLASVGCIVALGFHQAAILVSILMIVILLSMSALDKFVFKLKDRDDDSWEE